MADITIAQNDKGFYLTFTINDSDGSAYNLTGFTIKFKVWKANDADNLVVNGTCEIVSAVAGTCKYLVTATDFTEIEYYYGELELTKTGIIESTERFAIEVKESG